MGGAIFNGGTLTSTNDTFNNNTADYLGGAIFNDDGTLTVTNDTFNNNSAIDYGGAIYNSGNLVITNSTFNSNNAPYGGAIENDNNLTVNNSTLTNNTSYEGGAIFNRGGTMTVTGNNITNNKAGYEGSAIYNSDTAGSHSSAVVKFNRIVGNINSNSVIYSTNNSVNANYNWWGTNSIPASYVSSNVNVNYWLILTITATPSTIPNNSQPLP